MVTGIVHVSNDFESPVFMRIRLRREDWTEANSAIMAQCLRNNLNGLFVAWEASDGATTNAGKSAPVRREATSAASDRHPTGQ